MADRSRLPSTAALVLVTGVGPFATDTYLAALPEVQRSLATTAGTAQLTITAFLVGLAVGQLAIGPASDGRGRRTLLLAAAVTFALTSVLCALAPSGPALVAVRLVQGVAAGGGVVIGRAVVGDSYRGPEAAVRFSTLASVTFLGPVIAPTLGGVLLNFGSWRLVFVVLAVFGAAQVAAVWWGIPETLPPALRTGGGLVDTGRRVADLLRDRVFTYHVGVQCLAAAGFFTYIGGSSFVLQTVYGISPGRYAVVFATNAAAMAVTSGVGRLLVARTGPATLRRVGLATSTVAAVGLLVVALTGPGAGSSLGWPWVLLCLVVAGMGLSIPATTALAQEAGRRAGGTASALSGGLVFLVGAAATPLTGVVGYDTLLPMAACMAAFFVAALALLVGPALRRRTRP